MRGGRRHRNLEEEPGWRRRKEGVDVASVGLVGVVLESTKLREWGGGSAQARGLAAVLVELCTHRY